MKDEQVDALLWRLNLPNLREITEDYKRHLKREEALREKRLQLRETEKQELKRRDELLAKIRDHFNRTGKVGADLKNYSFVFKLGEHTLNSGLTVYRESQSRLHPEKNIVSLWQNKSHLEEFLKHKEANDRHFTEQRKRKIPDSQIALTVPFPGIQFSAAYCTELDVERIQNLVDGAREELYKKHGVLPRKPFPVIYEQAGARGLACILEVSFKQ